MTAVEITFMCLTVFAPLLIWFVVLLVRNKDLPGDGGNTGCTGSNNVESVTPDYFHDIKYTYMSGNIGNTDKN